MKKIYLVKLRPGTSKTLLEGPIGDDKYLFDCWAHEERDGQHRFLHGCHTDSVPSDRVESCRELSREEVNRLVYGEPKS
jgi:hypothetical protein